MKKNISLSGSVHVCLYSDPATYNSKFRLYDMVAEQNLLSLFFSFCDQRDGKFGGIGHLTKQQLVTHRYKQTFMPQGSSSL